MIGLCPFCKSREILDLTSEVESNEYFIRYFKKHIFCTSCETYMFIGDKKKLENNTLTPISRSPPPPKSGSSTMVHS
jgi:hypothetical protein